MRTNCQAAMSPARIRHLGCLCILAACGGGGTPGPGDVQGEMDVMETVDELPPEDLPKAHVEVKEDFRVVYGYQERLDPKHHELFLADPADSNPKNDISFTEAGLKKAGLNCNLGCFVDRKLKWIAVAKEQSQDDGTYTMVLGKFGTNMSVNILKFGDLKHVKHVEFAGDVIFFSQPQPNCVADEGPPSTCYAIKSLNLDTPGAIETHLTFPPSNALAHSMFSGWFSVGEDGKTLLFLNPSNVSQTVWIWRGGKLQQVGEKICAARDPVGNCIGSGSSSAYHDTDPIAMSPDGKVLVFALVEDNAELRLYRHDLETGLTKYSVLLGVPTNFYVNACENRQQWQYVYVRRPIRFTSDGKEVVFLGESNCKENKEKSWTNIVGIALDKIGTGKKLTQEDIRLVTDNPTGKVAKCVTIFYYDLSPGGEYVTFLGTPMYQSDGALIPDSSSAHLDDAEIWVTRFDGTTLPVQVTNNLSWKATSVLAVPTPK